MIGLLLSVAFNLARKVEPSIERPQATRLNLESVLGWKSCVIQSLEWDCLAYLHSLTRSLLETSGAHENSMLATSLNCVRFTGFPDEGTEALWHTHTSANRSGSLVIAEIRW